MAKSRCFVATLPNNMTDEQFEKLFTWSKVHCERSDFVRDNECVRLLVTRAEPRTQRDFQRILRTNLLNYGVPLPAKMGGWLKLFDECEYDCIKSMAAGKIVDESEESCTSSAPSPRSPSPPPTRSATMLRAPVNLLRAT